MYLLLFSVYKRIAYDLVSSRGSNDKLSEKCGV